MDNERSLKITSVCEAIIKWGAYALAFLLPLFFMPFNASVIELNKQLLLVVFALILLIAWLGKVITAGRLEFKKSWLNLGLVVFSVFYLVSASLSKNLYQSLVGAGGVMAESFFSLLALIIIFFVLINNLKGRQVVRGIVFALVLSGCIAGLFGALQLLGKFILSWDFAKIASFNTVGSVNSLEIFLAGLLVLSVALFSESNTTRWQQIFYGAAAVFFLLMCLSINFSNVWWGLMVTMIIVIALGIINRERVSQYRLILPMVVLAFAVLMLLPIQLNIFGKLFNVPIEVAPSLNASVDIDKQVLKEHLFFGTGPGSYAYDYGLYRSTALNQTDFWNVRFNQGLSKIVTQPVVLGLLGWLTWLAVVISFAVFGFIRLIKRREDGWVLALGVFSAWLFLAILQFFYTTNLTLELAFWLMLALAFLTIKSLSSSVVQTEGNDFADMDAITANFDRTSPLASISSFVFVIVLVITISVLYLGGSYYYADILYQRGSVAVTDKNDLEGGSTTISRAVMLNPYNDAYLRSLSQAALLRINQEFSKPQTSQRDAGIQNLIATAINIAKRSTDLAPLNVDNWAQRAIIYRAVTAYTSGADQWAIDSYKEATKLEPQNPFYFFELGRTYVLVADLLNEQAQANKEAKAKMDDYLARAQESFNQAVALKADYAPALFQLAVVYDRIGQVDEAVSKMKQVQAAYPQDVGVAFQLGLLYYKQNNLDLAKEQLERAVILDTTYSNARYFLGLTCDRQSNKSGALEQFEKIASFNPDNQDVKTILDNLRAGRPALTTQQPTQLPIREKIPQVQ